MDKHECYKVWLWMEQIYGGRGEQYNVAVCTKAKRDAANPYALANEVVCLRLAKILKLPIPYGGIVFKGDSQFFSSLEFGVSEESLPKPTNEDLDLIATTFPELACGIIVFDSWIFNPDRMAKNILYHTESQSTYLIDHASAFYFGNTPEEAIQSLEANKDRLTINHNNHCLAGRVATLKDFETWHRKIKEIPKFYIRDSIDEAVELGLPEEHADYCVEWLLHRRENLKLIFKNEYNTAFPNLDRQATLFDSPAPFQFVPGDYAFDI